MKLSISPFSQIALDISFPQTIIALMAQTPGEYLAEINHSLALAQTNLKRAFTALGKYEEAMGMSKQTKTHSIKCIAIWQEWLAENGPNTRSVITEETNTKLTERATPHTVVWDDAIDPTDDNAYPDDTLFRIRAIHDGNGRGAPPVVYFLWSQRWDIHPLFGVGPIKGEPFDLDYDQVETEDDLFPFPDSGMVTEEATPRFATMDEWNFAWGPLLSNLASAGDKPTAEQRQEMLDSLPDGQGPEALALAYSAAVRGPASIMGVAHPPASTHPLSDGPWEEQAIDWDEIPRPEPEPEPERSTWTMVGNHNHLPHPWGPLCAISQCQRISP